MATSAAAREHVTAFIMEQPGRFVTRAVTATSDDSDLRVTVDTDADLGVVRALWRALDGDHRIAPVAELVSYLRAHPALVAANAAIAQRSWHDSEVAHA
jgi:spore coat polysaccharide biosynthesis protein SpsF